MGLETKENLLAAATWVALRHGLQGNGKAATAGPGQPAIPPHERYDVVLSRLRNLLRKGLDLHGGGGKRVGYDKANDPPP